MVRLLIVTLLALFWLPVLSYEPAPSATVESTKGEQQPHDPTEKTANIRDPPAPILSILPSDTPTVIGKEHPEQGEDEPSHELFWKNPDWWIAGSTIILVFVTGILAWYTRRLFTATACLAKEAKVSADENIRSLRGADRPWLLLEDMKIEGLPNNGDSPTQHSEPKAVFLLKNYGRSPAFNMSFQERFWIVSGTIEAATIQTLKTTIEERIRPLAPNDWVNNKIPIDTDKLSEATRKEVFEEKAWLVLQIVVHYTDVFGEPHHTKLCIKFKTAYNAGWEHVGGPEHNSYT